VHWTDAIGVDGMAATAFGFVEHFSLNGIARRSGKTVSARTKQKTRYGQRTDHEAK
jgi:hypothetical protein